MINQAPPGYQIIVLTDRQMQQLSQAKVIVVFSPWPESRSQRRIDCGHAPLEAVTLQIMEACAGIGVHGAAPISHGHHGARVSTGEPDHVRHLLSFASCAVPSFSFETGLRREGRSHPFITYQEG